MVIFAKELWWTAAVRTVVNTTTKAAKEFIIKYNKSVEYIGNDTAQVDVLGTVQFHEELYGQIEVLVEAVKDIPWQYQEFQSVYNG